MIGIIPARGGSKRIKRKNIRPFHGKPILLYTIEAAKKCECIARVIVSTEDSEIANIARKAGAECYARPRHLADDYTTTKAVIRDVIVAMSLDSPVCALSAVSPFLTSEDLSKAYSQLNNRGFVFDCMKFNVPTPVQRGFEICNGKSKMIMPQHMNTRSQDLLPCYYHTGQFCLAPVSVWMKDVNTFDNGTPIVVDTAVDIDTEEDWQRANSLFEITEEKDDVWLRDYRDTKVNFKS